MALLLVACALLPLVHVAGDVPRGFAVTPAFAQSMVLPALDADIRSVSTIADLDDACEDVVQPPVLEVGTRAPPRLASPRSAPGLRTTTRAPLDRPPRLQAVG